MVSQNVIAWEFFAQVVGAFLSDDHPGKFVSDLHSLCLGQTQAIVLCFPFSVDPLGTTL